MDSIKQLLDYFLHLDKYLGQIISTYGFWTYGILFLIVFCETGLVITPFLPGDSLLFAAGALTASTPLQLGWVLLLLCLAATLGDTINYLAGAFLGQRLLQSQSKLIKPQHLERTHQFFERHGKVTIILARFVPVVRTFAPFVAGMGKMRYLQFMVYNVAGACLWVGLLVPAGRLFGNLPIVKQYFSLVVLAIIVLSVLPVVLEVWRQYRKQVPSQLAGNQARLRHSVPQKPTALRPNSGSPLAVQGQRAGLNRPTGSRQQTRRERVRYRAPQDIDAERAGPNGGAVRARTRPLV